MVIISREMYIEKTNSTSTYEGQQRTSNDVVTTTNVAGVESVSTGSSEVVSSTPKNSTSANSSTNSTISPAFVSSTITSSPILLSSQQTKGISEKQFLSLTKTLSPRPIKTVDRIIASFLFIIGGVNLWFVIKRPKKIDIRFPELAWRGITIILLAISFLVFNPSTILGGPLIIS